MTGLRRYVRTLALSLFAASCADERSGIGAAARLWPPLDLSMLTVTFREGDRAWEVQGGELGLTVGVPEQHPTEWGTGTSGSIDVAFSLADSSGMLQVSGRVTLPLRRDWRWHFTFENVTQDPSHWCFGCAGSRSFVLPEPLRAEGRDSLWVVWGGNSISHPLVYW